MRITANMILPSLNEQNREAYNFLSSYIRSIPADRLSYECEEYYLAKKLLDAQEQGLSSSDVVGDDPHEYALAFKK